MDTVKYMYKIIECSLFCLSLLKYFRGFTIFSAVEISRVEFLQFDFDTIEAATNNFCDDNKLGEGGFGEVYKVL
jgi:hypothetical protein